MRGKEMSNTLATLITMTTYGSWLRGDRRGWVKEGKILPANPSLEAADRKRMKHPPFVLPKGQLLQIGQMIGDSLIERKQASVFALSVSTWHCHFVVGRTSFPIGDIVKCAKDAVRYGLRPGCPIWTAGYDKRFCFDVQSVSNRVRYVQRHNEKAGWNANPWSFITDVNTFLDDHP